MDFVPDCPGLAAISLALLVLSIWQGLRSRSCEATRSPRRNLTQNERASIYEGRRVGHCMHGEAQYVEILSDGHKTMKWIQTKLAPALMVALLTTPAVTTAKAAEAEQQQQELSRAKVEFELRAGKKTIKFDVKTLDLGEQGTFTVEQDDHKYLLTARVEDAGDGKHANVVVDYQQDDKKILDGAHLKVALEGKAATKPAGRSKLKVRVSRGEPKSHRIEMPEGNDPLTGL
jgi:hypothetical protein